MVGGTAVDGTSNAAGIAVEVVAFDQAIFTSIRSPMGEGYRIVATSKGVKADEKREIVQSAPSHGALCNDGEDATGLASFTMKSGRRCVLMSRTAGKEHTGRGGYRVFTHVCLFDPGTYRRLHSDPFEISEALGERFDAEQMKKPQSRLEEGAIDWAAFLQGETAARGKRAPAPSDAAKTLGLTAAWLGGERMLVIGTPRPREALSAILSATPAYARGRSSFSYGMKSSPGRRFDVMLIDATKTELAKIMRDHDATAYQWSDAPVVGESPYSEWLRFVERRWCEDRSDAVREICAGIVEECEPAFLGLMAQLREHLENVAEADGPMLNDIERRHANEKTRFEMHAAMLAALKRAIVERRRQIEEEEKAKSEAESTDTGETY